MAPKQLQTTSKKSYSSAAKEYDFSKFENLRTSRKYKFLLKNRKFIKEKGFVHLEDFFLKDNANKGWKELCKSPKQVVGPVVREFYSNFSE